MSFFEKIKKKTDEIQNNGNTDPERLLERTVEKMLPIIKDGIEQAANKGEHTYELNIKPIRYGNMVPKYADVIDRLKNSEDLKEFQFKEGLSRRPYISWKHTNTFLERIQALSRGDTTIPPGKINALKSRVNVEHWRGIVASIKLAANDGKWELSFSQVSPSLLQQILEILKTTPKLQEFKIHTEKTTPDGKCSLTISWK